MTGRTLKVLWGHSVYRGCIQYSDFQVKISELRVMAYMHMYVNVQDATEGCGPMLSEEGKQWEGEGGLQL